MPATVQCRRPCSATLTSVAIGRVAADCAAVPSQGRRRTMSTSVLGACATIAGPAMRGLRH
ncbi:hypothetical protein WL03_10260 [Burkholderia ubonensis]|nr:hypothetical protein WL03_10260 [Burkholderia ubonensis]